MYKRQVDAEFPENAYAEIVDGRLILKKPPASELPPGIRQIDHLITERMENVSIVDVLIDTERWLQMHKLFRPKMCIRDRLKIAREGGQMTPADLAKFESQRRYATLVALAIEGMATVTDEIIDLHDRILGKLFNAAKNKHQQQFQACLLYTSRCV